MYPQELWRLHRQLPIPVHHQFDLMEHDNIMAYITYLVHNKVEKKGENVHIVFVLQHS